MITIQFPDRMGIEIVRAHLDNGLLHIDLERHVPEPEVKTIAIEKGGSQGKGGQKPRPQTIDVSAED